MKKITVFRVWCILLLFIMIFGLTACKKDKDNDNVGYDENRKLEILEKGVEYTSEELVNANFRFTKIGVSIFGNGFEERISNEFDLTIIPMLYRIKIYKSELDEIFTELEKHTLAEKTITDEPLFITVYDICRYVLGAERAGRVCYTASARILEVRISTALERYDKLGYDFYKTEAERCSALKESLSLMSENKFIDALHMSTTVSALVRSVGAEVTESAFLLSDKELLFLLERQTGVLEKNCLTEEEWEIFGGLFSELLSVSRLTPTGLTSSIIYALKNYTHTNIYDNNSPKTLYTSTYFARAMRVMPKTISLLARVSEALKRDGTFSLEDTSDKKLTALVRAFSECENDIRALDTALNDYARIDSEYLKSATESNSDAEALKAFINSHAPVSCDELINELNEFAEDGTVTNEQIYELALSYVFAFSPYIAFALSADIG